MAWPCAFDVVSQLLLQPFTIETQEASCSEMGAAAKTSFAAISAKPPPQRRGDYRQLIGQINCVRLKAVLPSRLLCHTHNYTINITPTLTYHILNLGSEMITTDWLLQRVLFSLEQSIFFKPVIFTLTVMFCALSLYTTVRTLLFVN